MKYFLVLWIGLIITPAGASESEEFRNQVLACVSGIDSETSWAECRTMMFEPCSQHQVGSEDHLGCLSAQQKGWQKTMNTTLEELDKQLTTTGSAMVVDIMGQWLGYVNVKCAGVAAAKAAISSDAAHAGCEIAETVGITSEFNTCLEGNSASPYCTFKE